ncbi:MAG: hypothetical protein A2939_00380 [Parcubacteria group bacterium RIFCSPLOWO2_01_FULL_48_18]|nr:MAG: hypothetical protein A2939_00380 [Parcubacteria group bacterium RIFCSPLOWO2_01_FULL_48_18]
MHTTFGAATKRAWLWCKRCTRIGFLKLAFRKFRPEEKKIFFVAFGAFLISTALLLVITYYQNTIAIPVAGGSYVEGIVGQPTVINPVLGSRNDVDRDLIELLFNGVFKSNGRGGFTPDLARRHTVSDDGRAWTIYLRDDAFWHDGQQVTADDVLFTIQTIQNPDAQSPLFTSWQGVVAERVSQLEIRLYLRNSYAPFEENLKDLKIIPEHIFGSIPAANLRLSDYNLLRPVGSGPYQFEGLRKKEDGRITMYLLKRNERYHLGSSFIEKMTFAFFENEDDLLDAFNKRAVDGFGSLNPKKLSELKLPHRLLQLTLPRYYAIFLNQHLLPALADKEVRRALQLATDKQSLIKLVFGGYGQPANGPLLKGMLGYDEAADQSEYNPGEAAEILDKVGWLTEENETIRTKKDAKLELTLVVPDTPPLIEAADFLGRGWQRIGIGVSIIKSSVGEIMENFIKGRNYPMLLFGNVVNLNSDLFAFWHSSQKFDPGLNLSLFDNKEVDALLESSRQSLEKEKRIADLKSLQNIIQRELPAIFLFSPDYLYVASNKLSGAEPMMIASPAERFSQIHRWSIKEARVFK